MATNATVQIVNADGDGDANVNVGVIMQIYPAKRIVDGHTDKEIVDDMRDV